VLHGHDKNGDDSWVRIWERKGRNASGKPEYSTSDLFAADGFDGVMAQTGPAAQEHIARIIRTQLGIRTGMRVLEAGCGAGAVLSLLRDTGAVFSGIDYSAPHLQIAQRVLTEMRFAAASASALPFADGAFEAAFSYGVFLYFPDLEYASMVLDEMRRVTSPGAPILILDIPDAARREVCEQARREAGAALHPPHCYYPRSFFEGFAARRGMRIAIEDQAVPGYANSRFRFNACLDRI
jgi:cyclopropane fatty-acyl-phospholipid synthase-like methyltransferase